MYQLPPELQAKIYSYDSTYRQDYTKAMWELKILFFQIKLYIDMECIDFNPTLIAIAKTVCPFKLKVVPLRLF